MKRKSSNQIGRSTLASGVVGIIGFAFLVAALVAPTPVDSVTRRYPILFLWQDGWLIAQTLLLIPAVFAVRRLMRQDNARADQTTFLLGMAGLLLVALTLALIFTGTASDMLYMAPQGCVGLWLVLANRGLRGSLPRLLTRLGFVAGIGLMIVALGFATYALLVEPRILTGPLSNAEIDAATWSTANIGSHIELAVGTLMGRSTFPVWTILLGRELLRQKP
jgi:NAD/NADP transhydrogenase beta subunit